MQKTCKLCNNKRYANLSICFKHHREREKQKKQEKIIKAKERKESTKKYQESLRKTLHNKAWH